MRPGGVRLLSDVGPVYTLEMSTGTWIDLADHPKQRNVERQARKPHWRLAQRASGAVKDALRLVAAADLEGTLHKVDGHTRALLWRLGKLPAPDTVFVTVHRVRSRDELDALYDVFHVPAAGENAYDQVYGAFRQVGLSLKSRRLREGFFASALNIALRGVGKPQQDKRHTEPIDIYAAVEAFKAELEFLDSVDPQPEVFYTGVVAAALIGLALYPESLEFFARLSGRQGEKRAGRADPVEAVLSLVAALKNQRNSWVNAQQAELCGRTLRALEAWREGPTSERYWLQRKPRAMDLKPYLDRLKQLKGIEGNPRL